MSISLQISTSKQIEAIFLDLLKEVESSLQTNRDCIASLKSVGLHVKTDTTTD